ncbi:HAD-IA family hydrolase [Nocardiopsis ganjiahuensis]|uniref:HAD-IA family hydrolase n=1 Tax=Nocardiopsis ganjiahuensis TaxID=239984 RepID=UPI000347FA38|nr:HAD-IA family hydrolase [Nocardiopsis ganjiahuensis]
MEAPFRAVLCDVDGVLRLWPAGGGMAGVDRAHGLPEGTLAATAFHPDHLLPAITGAVSDEEWREGIAAALADRWCSPERARAVVADWTAIVPGVNAELAALLRRVGRVAPVFLVSNATSRLESDLAALGLDDCATGVVNSSRVGVAKPDPRIYRVALDRLGDEGRGGSVLFVDDSAENVAAAREAGLAGVHYRGLDDVRELLESFLPAGSGPGPGQSGSEAR